MKRKKDLSRRDFIKNSTFITGSAAGAGLFVSNNPELEAAPSASQKVMFVMVHKSSEPPHWHSARIVA